MLRALRHRCSVLAPVGAVLALLAACGGGGGAEAGTPVPDGELRIAAQFAPRSGYAIDTDDAFILTQLGATEALTSASADGQARPALAESWTQVDPVTWRFVLRPGVTFHDGTTLTPAAVVTALSYVAGVQAPPRALKGIGLTVTEDGPNAVRVATASPDPILPLRMSSPNSVILASSAYTGGAPGVIGTGTGPMRLTATEGVQRAVLERFDGYWGGRATIARVTATFVDDPAARALALRAGDVDIALGLPESSLLEFSADSGFAEQTVAAPRTVSLLMNQSAAPFSDLRIRQAVARAIDRTALAEQALAGSALRRLVEWTRGGRRVVRASEYAAPVPREPGWDEHMAFLDEYADVLATAFDCAPRFRLEAGDLMALDNYRYLHGRDAFRGTRELHVLAVRSADAW